MHNNDYFSRRNFANFHEQCVLYNDASLDGAQRSAGLYCVWGFTGAISQANTSIHVAHIPSDYRPMHGIVTQDLWPVTDSDSGGQGNLVLNSAGDIYIYWSKTTYYGLGFVLIWAGY